MNFIGKRTRWSEAEHKHRLIAAIERLGWQCIQEWHYQHVWFDIVIVKEHPSKQYYELYGVIECKVERGRGMQELRKLDQIRKYMNIISQMDEPCKFDIVSFNQYDNDYDELAKNVINAYGI